MKDQQQLPKRGQLIVIEGASDGIGKSSQIKCLEDHLRADGVRPVKHHFPTYYSYQAACVERYLAGEYGKPDELSPYFINSLYAQDRAISWHTKLKSAYEKGKTILLDRYTTSSMIYQTTAFKTLAEKRKFLDYIDDFEYNKLGVGRPDLVIFLYAPIQTVNKMRAARTDNPGVQHDIHETDLKYLARVFDNAMFVAKHAGWTMINCATPGGTKMRSIEDIHKDVYRAVKNLQKSRPEPAD